MLSRIPRARIIGVTAAVGTVGALTLGSVAQAGPGGLFVSGLTNVPIANARLAGFSVPTLLSPELAQVTWAQGASKLENGTSAVPFYGYDGNGPLLPAAGDLPSSTHLVEATKTEPDKNTYLRLSGLHGADPAYDYGSHFLFQGHEGGRPGYITRINLDADGPHRVSLLATTDTAGAPLPDFDGSTWDPLGEAVTVHRRAR